MKELAKWLKLGREKKGVLLREVASKIDVDTALISKIENNDRRPTKEQLKKLSEVLEIKFDDLLTIWYTEKIYEEIKDESVAMAIMKLVIQKINDN